MSVPFDTRDLGAEHLQLDEDAERELRMSHLKQVARAAEVGCSYVAIALGIAVFAMMAIRCAVPAYHYLTASPAPRSPAPQAIATPQPRAFEAGARQPTQVR